MNYDVNYLKEYLKEYDVNPSNIRLQLLDRMLTIKNHPTAFELYDELIESIPTLSKTSVYNTLEIFSQKGIIKPVILDEAETRFDIKTQDHGHFKCYRCGTIYDLDLEKTHYKNLEDFKILDENIQLYGICKDCQK